MNADKGIKRQQRRLFIGQLLSFAGLFLVLGVIVFFLYERSIYQDIDHSLEQQKIMLTKPGNPALYDFQKKRKNHQSGDVR